MYPGKTNFAADEYVGGKQGRKFDYGPSPKGKFLRAPPSLLDSQALCDSDQGVKERTKKGNGRNFNNSGKNLGLAISEHSKEGEKMIAFFCRFPAVT